ncbi:hypothetical protein ACFFRR_001502 [Megaselia abdita]
MMRILLLICAVSIVRAATVVSISNDPEETIAKAGQRKEDSSYWIKAGQDALKYRLETSDADLSKLKAKNIIIFIGDGMGMTSITAGRIYKGQKHGSPGEEEQLVFDKFPYTGLSKTYNTDKQVPDSAATATAMFTGSKTKYETIGMDETRIMNDAVKGKLSSIMSWAQAVGKRTGIVTTTRITHATPAATYANVLDRDWECDSKIDTEAKDFYKDIAVQLVENSPGRNLNVILGGGRKPFGDPNVNETHTVRYGGDTEKVCGRLDNRNLTNEWLNIEVNSTRSYITHVNQLKSLDFANTNHLLGLFRNNHLTYSITKEEEEPSLAEMVEAAVKVLDKPNSKGFVLMVEGGRIDQAHHQNYARAAMEEMVQFDLAIEKGVTMTDKKNTLVIVTADHSHAVTLNGYPNRGNDILGFANKTATQMPYETLMYANGPGFYNHVFNSTSNWTGKVYFDTWKSIEGRAEERTKPTYQHMATLPLKDETHGGEDVIVFATGPGASLFRGVFEQNYIAHVMSYVGCMGPSRNIDNECNKSGAGSVFASLSVIGLSYVALFLRKFLF